MSDPNSHLPHHIYAPQSAPNAEAIPWNSPVARAAVTRTCYEVARRCQQVLAKHAPVEVEETRLPRIGSLDRDELRHVAVGDPDPTAVASMIDGYCACRFQWTDEISRTLVLAWSCTRRPGHPGQHLAGTGQWVAAVHPR